MSACTYTVIHVEPRRAGVRDIYLYAVCLVTIIVTLFSVVRVARNLVELAYDDPYLAVDYIPECPPDASCVPPQQATREVDTQRQQRAQHRYAILNIVEGVVTLSVAVPMFILHWRRAEHDRPVRRTDDGSA